jgi:DNA-binding GntR family transcriptional regulator
MSSSLSYGGNEIGETEMESAATVDGNQRRGQTVEDIVGRLREAIFAGRIVPGQRLIANDLTEQLGVGRGSIREAFQRLAADGLLDIVPNRGAIVRRLSRDSVRELFQIRVNLEGLGSRLAAEHIDEADHRDRFLSAWNMIKPDGSQRPWALFMQQNRIYHRTIVSIGENRQLTELIDNLQLPIVMFQVGQAMRPENSERSHRDHVVIADAILSGDGDAAENAMRNHLKGTAEWILQLPNSAFGLDL